MAYHAVQMAEVPQARYAHAARDARREAEAFATQRVRAMRHSRHIMSRDVAVTYARQTSPDACAELPHAYIVLMLVMMRWRVICSGIVYHFLERAAMQKRSARVKSAECRVMRQELPQSARRE